MSKLTSRRAFAAAVTAVTSAIAEPATASCGSAACLVNTQWQIHGIPTEAGARCSSSSTTTSGRTG